MIRSINPKPVVHVIGGDPSVENMFRNQGFSLYTGTEDISLVCFTGGEDISPALYCEMNISSYGVNPTRDIHEVGQYLKYQRRGIPMVGICRGAQFLNVMLGGSMVQHIPGHTNKKQPTHLFSAAGELLRTVRLDEDHHQAMVPREAGIVLGQARDGTAEIVWYPDHHEALCFQAHPEWGHAPTRELFFELIQTYLGVTA